MFDGPFRSYQDRSTQQCMQDLMDGYFPSELQERFPEGVPLEVYEEFIFKLPWSKFPGEGQAVRPHFSLFLLVSGKKVSTDQFLNRLPKMVVKGGRVIDIRDSVRDTLLDVRSSCSLIAMLQGKTGFDLVSYRLQTYRPDRPGSARDVTTLKVKSEDGDHTFILKMCFSETVGQLRHCLFYRGGGLPDYDIISVYPRRCYDDDSQTLQSCGLTVNATLLLQKRKTLQRLDGAAELQPASSAGPPDSSSPLPALPPTGVLKKKKKKIT
uniref:UBX domain-containing protein 11 n=1 Tax=Mola mola TaxID=94237 RepID=A0A3Q3WHI4_MOLML